MTSHTNQGPCIGGPWDGKDFCRAAPSFTIPEMQDGQPVEPVIMHTYIWTGSAWQHEE